MKYNDTPMGKAFEIAIKIGNGEEVEKEENGEENGEEESYSKELAHNPKVKLAPAEAKYVESMYEIVAEYGKLADNDGNGIWVGYVPASENADAKIGVKCDNCSFYCVEMKECHIIAEDVEPNGYCRLAAIGERTR